MVAEQDADTAKDRAPVSSSLQFLPSIIGETSRRDETELSQAVSEHRGSETPRRAAQAARSRIHSIQEAPSFMPESSDHSTQFSNYQGAGKKMSLLYSPQIQIQF